MSWEVRVSKKAVKQSKDLPAVVVDLFKALLVDLGQMGPIQYEWPNYSKLTLGRYHCHLNHRYVAVWEVVDNKIKILEVTYVGSRRDAPY